MQKLVFINGSGNEIDLTSGNFGITNWEGLSNTGLNIQTQQVPFEDGGVFLDALMEQREIAVTVAIYDGNNLELRYQKKRELISALNPKFGEGTLIYTNDYLSKQIKAVPQIPLFENKNSNDAGTLKASVAFSCPNPYWEDVEETVLSDVENTINIINNGDVPIGLEIEIKNASLDEALHPYIKNLSQNKVIEYNGNIDEIPLEITTKTGEKKVIQKCLDPSTMQLETVNGLWGVTYSKYYRKYFSNFVGDNNYILKSSTDGVIWEDVVTTKYARFSFYNEILIMYANSDSDEIGQKLYISRDLNTFQTVGTNLNDPDDEMTSIVIFPTYQNEFRIFAICGSIYVSTRITPITTYINFTAKNLPLTYFRVYTLLYNPRLRTVFAISERNCYKYTNQEDWELTANNLYDYLPYSTFIEETGEMVCYGTQYGIFSHSTDGINWITDTEGGTGCTILSVIYDAEKKLYFAGGNDTGTAYIGFSKDLDNWERIKGTEDFTNGIAIYSNGFGTYLLKITYGNYNVAFTDLDVVQNRISKLTSNSDLNLGLIVGENVIIISDSTKCDIKYRQKYIGV